MGNYEIILDFLLNHEIELLERRKKRHHHTWNNRDGWVKQLSSSELYAMAC